MNKNIKPVNTPNVSQFKIYCKENNKHLSSRRDFIKPHQRVSQLNFILTQNAIDRGFKS